MSAILSADDLNDFISPGVACIKPIETLPAQNEETSNPYEVTTEDKVAAANPPPAQISLTDCLACSGCVTSAEAVLVSLQSHTEVLNTLDAHPELPLPWHAQQNGWGANGTHHRVGAAPNGFGDSTGEGRIFVASVSPQARASLAATYGVSEREAGHMVEQLLSGPHGLRSGGKHGSGFTWVIDTNTVREAALVLAADEVLSTLSPTSTSVSEDGSLSTPPKKPILTSACPGWICYAEKTHPYVLPHLSRMKSPQALAGTLIKSILYRKYGIHPSKVWHLAVMPCFDKKLEASRSELTSNSWLPSSEQPDDGIRDVDCVITARELLMLAQSRNTFFPHLPRVPLPRSYRPRFPDPTIDTFLFPRRRSRNGPAAAGPSGGYLYHIMQTFAAQNPGSSLHTERGRNADVVEFVLRAADGSTIIKSARFYGFRNIQNLVRRLKPARASRLPGAAVRGGARRPGGGAVAGRGGADSQGDYAYVEVMACPGGCTNGGGQIKVGDLAEVRTEGGAEQGMEVQGQEAPAVKAKPGPQEQREWLAKVDEAYFSMSSASEDEDDEDVDMEGVHTSDGSNTTDVDMRDLHAALYDAMDVDSRMTDATPFKSLRRNGTAKQPPAAATDVSAPYVHDVLEHWAQITGIDVDTLTMTSYRKVESDVGKQSKVSDVERVAGLASSIGGGW
ncbi:cytosolic Fe-S cluster assembly factor NAR1 [Phyllosticta citriasiana]|uniref:Nuclear architecture-related protein 1 n=1 Tax=Phyllosticta citriasiana TaxID=595635 RepID=A0ABR1KFN9_9PEZI